MLGLALLDPATRQLVGQVIDSGQALPQGLAPSPAQFRAAVESNAADAFGLDPALVCPFLQQTGQGYGCAIHPYRNSICATYFCEHDHGAREGEAYWRAVQALVGLVETVVAQWAADQVGLDSADLFARLDALAGRVDALSAPETGGWSQEARRQLWGAWLGRERAFFEACAAEVMERRDELHAIARATPLREARAYERALHAWIPAALHDELPPLSAGEPVPAEALWYSLQLKTRQLWELPFGEGEVALAPGATVTLNPRDDAVSRLREAWPEVLADGEERVFLTTDQARALRLFGEPRVLGEALFQRPEIEALDDARRLLAECMRRGLLVQLDRG